MKLFKEEKNANIPKLFFMSNIFARVHLLRRKDSIGAKIAVCERAFFELIFI